MKKWTVTNTKKAKYIGFIEFQSTDGEWHNFEVLQTNDKLVFGEACNIGFLESGYMEIDSCFTLNENMQALLMDLETFYNDGPEYVSSIVFNDRM